VEACNAHGVKALGTMEGRTIGAFMSMTGPLHNITLWWWFEDAAEREARVSVLTANAGWQAFVETITPLLVDQSSLLMMPRPVPAMSPLFG